MCKLFDFDFITASSFCHHDIMTMSSLGYMKKNNIYEHEIKKGSKYEKFNLFLR